MRGLCARPGEAGSDPTVRNSSETPGGRCSRWPSTAGSRDSSPTRPTPFAASSGDGQGASTRGANRQSLREGLRARVRGAGLEARRWSCSNAATFRLRGVTGRSSIAKRNRRSDRREKGCPVGRPRRSETWVHSSPSSSSHCCDMTRGEDDSERTTTGRSPVV